MGDLLSQNEIDSLLAALSSGQLDVEDMQEKDEKQIAELLRVSVNTVKTHKQRAKAYLKGRLGELFVYMTLFFFEF